MQTVNKYLCQCRAFDGDDTDIAIGTFCFLDNIVGPHLSQRKVVLPFCCFIYQFTENIRNKVVVLGGRMKTGTGGVGRVSCIG